jgi:hypothetical protein
MTEAGKKENVQGRVEKVIVKEEVRAVERMKEEGRLSEKRGEG